MRKRQKDAILISFFKEKEKYEKLAEYLISLIWEDPSAPKESLHTIKYRIKEKARLLEKIDEENKRSENKAETIIPERRSLMGLSFATVDIPLFIIRQCLERIPVPAMS